MPSLTTTFAAALAAAVSVQAQTYSSCNPTENTTCSPDVGLSQWSITTDFTKGESEFNKSWTAASGTTITFDDTKGAVFNMSVEGQAPTISTNWKIFFGKVEAVMRAAPGTGIVSSVVMESADLDEIDWEWLGGDTTQVETNYFGKGNTSSYDRATYVSVTTPQDAMHTYAVEWTKDHIEWSVDGTVSRTLPYANASGGEYYPQTPMEIKLGNWDGGASTESEGTIEWAGGETDWDNAPFVMYVKSITVTNYNPADYYNWTDTTGSYTSIDAYNSTSDSSSSSSGSSSTSSKSTTSSSSSSSGSSSSSSSSSGDSSSGANQIGATVYAIGLISAVVGCFFL